MEKDIETINQSQEGMKNITVKVKTTLERIKSRLDEAEDQISELEDKIEKHSKRATK